MEHVVLVLVGGDGGDGHSPLHEVDGVIGEAAVADFALLDQLLQLGPGLFDGGVGIGVVKLVQVEVIGLEVAQGPLQFTADALRFEGLVPAALTVVQSTTFAEEVDFVPPSFDGPGDELFGPAPAVKGGGIDPVDAEVKGGPDGPNGVSLILRPPIDTPG